MNTLSRDVLNGLSFIAHKANKPLVITIDERVTSDLAERVKVSIGDNFYTSSMLDDGTLTAALVKLTEAVTLENKEKEATDEAG